MVFGDGMSRTVSFGLGCWFLVCFDENNMSRCGRVKETSRVIKNEITVSADHGDPST